MTFDWILSIIVVVNAMATIALWQTAARRPDKLKKKFLKRLWDGKPIAPKHQPPPALDPNAWGVDQGVRLFFDDFKEFANVVNWWLAEQHENSPWRLQELPDAELRLGFYDSPHYGRRYAIFHNQVRLGTLELSAFLYGRKGQHLTAEIELDFVRLLPFNTIHQFLGAIALHICDPRPDSKEMIMALQQIDRAMTAATWRAIQVDRFDRALPPGHSQIEVRIDGSAEWYFTRRDCEAFNDLKRA